MVHAVVQAYQSGSMVEGPRIGLCPVIQDFRWGMGVIWAASGWAAGRRFPNSRSLAPLLPLNRRRRVKRFR
jgi:hypothetical protein